MVKKKILLTEPLHPRNKQHPEQKRFWRSYLSLRIYDGGFGIPLEELSFYDNLSNQNIGLLHLAGILKKRGHEVRYIAPQANLSEEDYISSVLSSAGNTDYIGFYAHTCQIPLSEQIIDKIKKINPKIKAILGGPHATAFEHKERHSFDTYVWGRAHKTLPWLIESNSSREVVSEKDVPEDYFREKEPQAFPEPDNTFMNIKFLPSARIYTTMGCGKKVPCTFCGSIINHRRYSHGNLEKVLAYTDDLVKNYGTKHIYVGDENFFRDSEHSAKFVKELGKYKGRLKFFVQANAESIAQHLDLLKILADSEMCTEVQVGAESAHQEILNMSRKGLKAKLIGEVGKIVKDYGMRYYGNWLSWLPGETKDTHRYTTEKICELINKGLMDYAESYSVIPSPGSEIYREREKFGLEIVDWNYANWKGETMPVFKFKNGPSREKMYELEIERIKSIADIYESRIPQDFSKKLGIDPSRNMSGF